MNETSQARYRGSRKKLQKINFCLSPWKKLTSSCRTSRNVSPAWHGNITGWTTFAGITAKFLITWTFSFAHFILGNTLVVETTITFGIRMNSITFIDTYFSFKEKSFFYAKILHWFLSAKFTDLLPQKTRSYSIHCRLSASNNCLSGQFNRVRNPLSHW